MYKQQIFSSYMLKRQAKTDLIKNALDVKHIIMIQAGPGQGKTLFAKNIGETCYEKSLYYKVTEADRDAVHFCISLHSLFSQEFPKYSCPDFDKIVGDGTAEAKETENYIKLIIKSLRKNLIKKTVVILDDLHLLPDIGLACMTVLTAVASSGGLLSFILCTLSSCRFPEKFSRLNKTVIRLDNDFLALTEQEFRELAVNLLDESCSLDGLNRIYSLTEGWTAGTVKILENLAPCRKEDMGTDSLLPLFDDYFSTVTAKYNKKNLGAVYMLSLPESFESDFVEKLEPKAVSVINDMLMKNTFTSVRNGRIVFNRLFREWLRHRASKVYSEGEIAGFFVTAYGYEAQRGNSTRALAYLIRSKNFALADEYIEKNYYDVISLEYSRSLHSHLLSIPEEVLRDYPWMLLLSASVLALSCSGDVSSRFHSAYSSFKSAGNKPGIMAACAGLVCMYTVTDGDMEKADIYLKELKNIAGDYYPDEDSVPVCLHMAQAMGSLYMYGTERAVAHLDRAHTLVGQSGSSGIRIRIYAAYALAYQMQCEKEQADRYCDAMVVKLNASGFNADQKLFVMEHMVYYTAVQGMHGFMGSLIEMIKSGSSLPGVERSKLSGFMDLACADAALASGMTDEAVRIMNTYSDRIIDMLPAHRASLMYAWKALTAACGCDESAAVYAEKSVSLRESIVCSRYFVTLTNYFAGASFALAGSHKRAEHYLMLALEDIIEGSNLNASAGAFAYLSYLYNNIGDRLRAREYAVYSLKMFKRTNYTGFIGLLPEVMLSACSYAYTDAAVSQFASQIAFERYDTAFMDLGRRVPVMKIYTLDGLTISIGGKVMDCSDIGANFRLLIASLMSSGGYGMEQEVIQSTIWPESSREHARKSFDNLISRFRKMVAENFAGVDPKDYLTINNGVLKFRNIKCDADEFLALVKSARDGYVSGGYSKAAEALIKAEKMFQNRYFVNVSSPVGVVQKRRAVDSAFISMLKTMHRVGFFLPGLFHPERFFDMWLDTFMSDTEMVATAFSYYAQRGMHQKCREIIRDFTAHLNSEGYTENEIGELVYMVKTSI